MTKKTLNQNTKYAQELIDMIEPDFFLIISPLIDLLLLKMTITMLIKIKLKNYPILKEK